MSDLLAEVDAAMRQERLEKLWKQHGSSILLGLAAVVLATAVGSGFKHWNHAARVKQTDALIALLDDKDFPANVAAAELDMRGGLRGIALLSAAGALMDEKKPDEALALYDRAAEDSGIPGDLRDLAILMSARLNAEKESTDKDLQKMLKTVYSDGGSPWRGQAWLESAALYAAAGDFAQARRQLENIRDEKNLPPGLHGKAKALDHVYALQQDKQAAGAPKTEGDS